MELSKLPMKVKVERYYAVLVITPLFIFHGQLILFLKLYT